MLPRCRGLAEEEDERVQGVDAQIAQGAAPERGVEDVRLLPGQHVVVPRGAFLVPEGDPTDPAESRQDLLDRADAGVVGRAHRLQQHDVPFARAADEPLPLLRREGGRLFHEHRDAGIHRRPHLLGMHGVGARDVHGIAVTGLQQPREAVGDARRPHPLGEVPPPGDVAGGHPPELDAVDGMHGPRQLLGDGTGADDADADHPLIIPCRPLRAHPVIARFVPLGSP